MLGRVSLAGPGPATLLARSLRTGIYATWPSDVSQVRRVRVAETPSGCRRTFAGVSTASTSKRTHAARERSARRLRPSPAVNVENAQTHPTLAQASADDLLPHVLYLPPPLSASNYEFHLSQLRTAVDNGYGLADVIQRWGLLRDSNAVRMATTEDYEAVSDYLAGCFSVESRLNVRKLYDDHPEKWGIMTHMAVEAAAHGQWHGLHEILLHLLSAQMPEVTKTLWLAWHTRVRQVLNRPWEMLFSEDRKERVRARLRDIPGVTPLMMPFIASLAMLKQANKDNFKFLLGLSTAKNDNSTSNHPFVALWQHIRTLPNEKQLRQDVAQIWHDRTVVQTIHHADALAKALLAATLAENFKYIEHLYLNMIRLATPGPNQLLMPVTATTARLAADGEIVLPVRTWTSFTIAFSEFTEHRRMFEMATVDHPACSGQLDPSLLANTMAEIASLLPHARSDTEKDIMLKRIESLWDNIVALGHGSSREPIVKRLRTISFLGGVYTPTVVQAYFDSCWKQLRRDNDHQALAWLVSAQCANILNTNWMKLPDFLKVHHSVMRSRDWSQVVTSIVTLPRPYTDRVKLVRAALPLIPRDVRLRGLQFGRLMAFFVEGDKGDGDTVGKCLDLTRKAMKHSLHPEIYLKDVVNGILKTPPPRAGSVPLRYELALRILEDLFPRGPDAHTSAQSITWTRFLIKVASTNSLDIVDRHNLIAAAVACYPQNTDYDLGILYSVIIDDSLGRSDGHGIQEARYWLRQWTKPFKKQFHYTLWQFVEHGRSDEAREFAAQHPDIPLPLRLRKAMRLDTGATYVYGDDVDSAEEIQKEIENEIEMESENDYDNEGDNNTYA